MDKFGRKSTEALAFKGHYVLYRENTVVTMRAEDKTAVFPFWTLTSISRI